MTTGGKFQNEDLVRKGQATRDEKTDGYDWKMEMRSWSYQQEETEMKAITVENGQEGRLLSY